MASRLLNCSGVPAELIPVAIVVTSFEPGGTERQMSELIRRLPRGRFRVHAVCFRRVGEWLPKVETAAHEVADFPLRSFKSPATVRAMHGFVSWLRSRRIAIVQTSDRYSNIFALPAAALARVPVRIGGRREIAPPDQTRAHAIAMRLAYRAAHRVVANCAAAAQRLVEEGVPAARISTIPNGIDLAPYAPPVERESRRTVAVVANLREGKGHDVLLRAAALVLRRAPDVRFRLIGEGMLRQPLEQLASALGVHSSVEFLGHREDVPALLASSDLYVFPSWSEAFPNGLIEGMAAGLPVVASAVGGMLELVDHGRNGLLVPPRDEQALAAAILDIVEQPRLAERLALAARDTVETRYSFDRMVNDFERMYLSELTARAAAYAALQQVA